ncbi:MAG TPA: HTTM domain-containing protein [Kofleriaceae bacterium]|nr:HTTM domain-containing protein [Kofleriaceae bacterium]
MTRLREAWRAWVELADRREPPTALALVRIAVGLVMLGDFLWVWHVGLVDPLWSHAPLGFATSYRSWTGLGAHGLWLAATLASAAVLVGAGTRVACVALLLVSAQLAIVDPNSESAIDAILRVVLAILALSRCNARWSVDAWIARRLGRPMPAEIPAWPRYLLMIQLVWIYFSAGQNKSSAAWGPLGGFTALANALGDPHAARWAPGWLAVVYPLTRVATALTITFELTAPAYLLYYYYAATAERPGRLRAWCNRLRLRWAWIAIGVMFELGIAVTMRLGSFPFGMLALYPVLLRPRELQRWNTAAPENRASSPS